ncbi:MAG TPA: hypothetical protein PKX54_05880 [Candidatus Dojkabacteria bacterium]|nr:hypothetical protein [Candidatus Dojkabacteria bacterium]
MLSAIFFTFFQHITTSAQTISTPQFKLEITTENKDLISPAAKNSILDTLNNRWRGDIPLDNIFYLPNIRWENDWAIADIHYKKSSIDYTNPENSPINNSFSVILAINSRGVWQSAFTDEPQAADIARMIPDEELSYEAKTTLLTHFPSQYKTMSLNIDYKLPWSKSGTKFFFSGVRTTNTQPCPNNSGWHGALPYLGGEPCHALDFAPRLSSTVTNADILSPVTGYVYQICKNPGSQKQSALAIKATNSNQIIGIWHLDKETIPSRIKQGELIKQGEFLGQMVEGSVNESKSTCPLVSQGTHIHLVSPYRPFTIDSYTFTLEDKVIFNESEHTMSAFQNTDMVSTNGNETSTSSNCRPPVSGDWVISENCDLSFSTSVPNNIIINDGKSLTINSNVTLDMNLGYYRILIKPNAKLLVNSGAKII